MTIQYIAYTPEEPDKGSKPEVLIECALEHFSHAWGKLAAAGLAEGIKEPGTMAYHFEAVRLYVYRVFCMINDTQSTQETQPSPSGKPTHVYIARKPCGCVVGLVTDLADKATGEGVAEFIADGCAVSREYWQTYTDTISQDPTFMDCPHGQKALPLFEKG